MGESQKIECIRFALASLLSVCRCVAPKLNQARFVRVQFQPKLTQTFPPFLEELFGLSSMLKSQHHVVSVSHNDHVSRCSMLSPVLCPQVENVM
jgi:hypothetical protein